MQGDDGEGVCLSQTACPSMVVLVSICGGPGLTPDAGCCITSAPVGTTVIRLGNQTTMSTDTAAPSGAGRLLGAYVGGAIALVVVVSFCAVLAWKANDWFFFKALKMTDKIDYGEGGQADDPDAPDAAAAAHGKKADDKQKRPKKPNRAQPK